LHERRHGGDHYSSNKTPHSAIPLA
jgi:hypothetical protein